MAEGRLGPQLYTPQVAADLLRFCTSDLILTGAAAAAALAAGPGTGAAPAQPGSPGAGLSGLRALVHLNVPVAGVLSHGGGEPTAPGGSGAAALAAAAAAPLDLDALRDCRGLPFASAGGRVRLLGVDRCGRQEWGGTLSKLLPNAPSK